VSAVNTTSITLTWTRSPDGATYTVTRVSESGAVLDTKANLPNSTTSCTFSGLTPGSLQYFRIMATLDGQNIYGDPLQQYARTGAPAGLRVTDTKSDSFTVSWNAPAGAVSVYTLQIFGPGKNISFNTTETTYSVTGLTAGSEYQITVYARSGSAPVSETVSITAATPKSENPGEDSGSETGPLESPTGLAVASVTSTSIRLKWNAVDGAQKYRVLRSGDPNGAFTEVGVSGEPSYTDKSLKPSTAYWYKVVAISGSRESAESSVISTTTGKITKPKAPTGLKAVRSEDGRVTLSWSAVSDSTGYTVYRSESEDGDYEKAASVSGNRWTDTSAPGGDVWYKVSASNAAGESERSSAAAALALAPDYVVMLIRAEDITSESAVLSWDAVDGAAGYYLCRSDQENGEYIPIADTQQVTWNDADISQGATLYYIVSAYNADMEEIAVSDALPVTIPLRAGGLTVRAQRQGSDVYLEWEDLSSADGYRVLRAASNGDYIEIASIDDTSWTDTGLQRAVSYTYRIEALKDGEVLVEGSVSVRIPVTAGIDGRTILIGAGAVTVLLLIVLMIVHIRRKRQENERRKKSLASGQTASFRKIKSGRKKRTRGVIDPEKSPVFIAQPASSRTLPDEFACTLSEFGREEIGPPDAVTDEFDKVGSA